MIQRTSKINGIEAVTTGELCRRLGFTISATAASALSGVLPLAETATGTYWREAHIPIIAAGIARHLFSVACEAAPVGADQA